MSFSDMKPRPGDSVVLLAAPAELLRGLPREDQKAISAIVGKPIVLVGYDDDGRAELEFADSEGGNHSIWVDPSVIRPVK